MKLRIMRFTLFMVLSLICYELFGQTPKATSLPNIMIILSDDLTYHDLGCYGNDEVQTPNIDKLAKEGMKFNYCFNSSPMCAPTRMSLFTGIHPVRNGAYPNHSKVHDRIRSLPHYLERKGYRSALIGKKHYQPEANFPFEHLGGREHDNGKGLDLDLSKVKEFIESSKDQPWCLVVSSNQAHSPWNKGDASKYDAKKLTLPPYLVDTEKTRAGLVNYYAEISYFDQQLGTCMQYLEESGEANQTIVIYLSEQGSNFPHCKWTCYDTGLRSAAIIRYPGLVEANSSTDAMIQYIDVLPTLLEIIKDNTSKYDLDGKSFLPILKKKKKVHHKAVFGIQTSKGIYDGPEAYGIRTIRTKNYRLIWNINWQNKFSNMVIARQGPYGIFGSWMEEAESGNTFAAERVKAYEIRPEWEFYDLQKDPYELNNLSQKAEYHAKINKLKKKLLAWMKQQGDKGIETELNAIDRQWKK